MVGLTVVNLTDALGQTDEIVQRRHAQTRFSGGFETAVIPTDVSRINRHGTSTQLGDPSETEAIKQARCAFVYWVSNDDQPART